MERVRGRTIDRLLNDGGLPLPQLLDLSIQMADALVSAHGQGVVHRDLKPSNVMVDENSRVKVIDFGLAKLLTPSPTTTDPEGPTAAQTVEGRILGTPAYMSPEQLNGQPIDHRSDLFSFGILLYELCTGRRPFTGDSTMAVISSILRDAPPAVGTLRPDLPPELGRLVRHCLEKDSKQRVQSAQDLL
jgi:serine/threonine-protein kinase